VADAGEVGGAGGVEGLLRAPGRDSGEQDGVFVSLAGGGVDGEAEGVGGAAVAQPEQRELLAAGQDRGDVGEAAAAGDLDFLQLGPVLFSVVEEPQGDGAAGGGRDGGHGPILPFAGACPGYDLVPGNELHECNFAGRCPCRLPRRRSR
jgi:hypothetical protein